MSAQPAYRSRGLLAAALARAEAWFLEPAEVVEEPVAPAELRPRPVVAVAGLAARCGTTTVARALGAEMAAREREGACAVSCSGPPGAIPLGNPAATRLARTLGRLADGRARPAGRLCLIESSNHAAVADGVRYLSPLVLDLGQGAVTGPAVSLADHVVLVASAAVEPALAAVVATSLARVGPEPITVLNRALDTERWAEREPLVLPESRMGAQLALAGREARGELGRAVAVLADCCGERG